MNKFFTIINILCIIIPIMCLYVLQIHISPVIFTFILVPIIYYYIRYGEKFVIKLVYILLTLIAIVIALHLFNVIDMALLFSLMTDIMMVGSSSTLIMFMINTLMKENEYLMEIIMKDPLTNLFNKRYFMLKLNKEFTKYYKENVPLALLMIDIDYFKKCNDTCGHLIGDMILQEFSQILVKTIRNSDVAVRYGGEEFSIILSNTSPDEVRIIAERIKNVVENYDFVVKKKVKPCKNCKKTISIGIANMDDSCKTPLMLVDRADQALYKAKEKRNDIAEY